MSTSHGPETTGTQHDPPSRPELLNGSNNLATIADLPTELLLVIFNLVYRDHRCLPFWIEDFDEFDIHEPAGSSWANTDVRAPILFPYCLASVCRRWVRVLSRIPQYWTRLVVHVDEDYAPADLASQAAWSQDLPFELTLQRRIVSPREVDHNEGRRVLTSMAGLMPHIHRCTMLHISVTRSSSLPSLDKHFSGAAELLEDMTFSYIEDDGALPVGWPRPASPAVFPQLDRLSIDAANFMSMALNPRACYPKLASLTMVDFSSTNNHGVSFPLPIFLDTLSQFPMLQALKIADIDFTPLNGFRSRVNLHRMQSVTLTRISEDAICGILPTLSEASMDILEISQCQLPSVVDFDIPSSYYLTLEQIENITDPEQFVLTFVEPIVRGSLHVVGCPGVASVVCRKLGERMSGPTGVIFFEELLELSFVDSPGVDHAVLKASLTQREQWYAQTMDDWRIDSFTSVRSAPAISSNDLDWLKSHLGYVHWEALAS
ncbi:hypothetical protein HGRIS_010195 [Hohenbuehelia grisea]|uniref:F-box domain-containing protein n=1 Tax=Hohenbuehelia grisea TaxID=104357 RepID=A0ABR3J3X6_9AGAR